MFKQFQNAMRGTLVRHRHSTRKSLAVGAVACALASPLCLADKPDYVEFDLAANPTVLQCLAKYPGDPSRQPQAHIKVFRGKLADTMLVGMKNIKPNLKFDLFTVERSSLDASQVPVKPFPGFGLSWYQSDLEVNDHGYGYGIIKTILLDQIFGFDQENKDSERAGFKPINTFHVGFWFNDPKDAEACGFTGTTPFNGEHKAGPLAMISTPKEETGLGPLCTDPDFSQHPTVCNP